MSDENVEQEARKLGWIPQEDFHGDPEKFVSAEEFVERGKSVMPLLKAHNRKLETQVSQLSGEVQELRQLLSDSKESMEAMKELHEENTKRKVAEAKNKLLSELRQAKADGDIDAEVQITDELSELHAVEKATKAPVQKPNAPAVHPTLKAWAEDNPWYGVDLKKTAMMNAIATEMRAEDPRETLKGREFLDAVTAKVDEFFSSGIRSGKVEGGRPSPQRAGGKTYADLPADAKAVCDRQVNKMVGTGRAFKDKASWQSYYAKIFFEGEE